MELEQVAPLFVAAAAQDRKANLPEYIDEATMEALPDAARKQGASVQGQRRKRRGIRELAMSQSTPTTIQKLQAALHAKAKGSLGYRFYALHDKVCRPDVLVFAYHRCKANGGWSGCGAGCRG